MSNFQEDFMDLVEQTKELIDKSSSILVVTGAGISTGAGIPDFRSEGGLYDMVRKKFNLEDPTQIFDIGYFINNPSLFYEIAHYLTKDFKPTTAHKYIADLEKDHSVTVLTQNIDGLHIKAGSKNVIPAHGTMNEAYCLNCGHKEKNPPYNGYVLTCEICGGLMKPTVVFFRESLPRSFFEFYENWRDYNFDLLLVVGTGLEVYPVAGLVYEVNKYINDTIYVTKNSKSYLNATIRVTEDIQKFFKKLIKPKKNGFLPFINFFDLIK